MRESKLSRKARVCGLNSHKDTCCLNGEGKTGVKQIKGEKSRSLTSDVMLGCTLTGSPASRRKKEPGVSNRDISGLMDAGAYTLETRSWRDTLLCVAQGGQNMVAVFTPGGKGR